MKKKNLYNVLGIICGIIWIITMILQVMYPHPYRGLIGNIVLLIGLLFFYIHAKINQIKSPLYNPDKKKCFCNWVIFIMINLLTIIMVGFLFWKVF